MFEGSNKELLANSPPSLDRARMFLPPRLGGCVRRARQAASKAWRGALGRWKWFPLSRTSMLRGRKNGENGTGHSRRGNKNAAKA